VLAEAGMSTTRRLLIAHPSVMRGENRGLFVQHVESLQWLLTESHGWRVAAMDPLHRDFPTAAVDSDVVVLHMLPDPEVEALIHLRRERRLPTVFELADNFLGLGEWLPPQHLLRSPLVRQRLLHLASIADAVQVYAPGLAELFRRVNPRITCFDPYVPLPTTTSAKPAGFVIGWGGTTSHDVDLARIAPAIVALCARHPDAVFAYMGDVEMHARHFRAIPPAQTIVRPFGTFDDYFEHVSGLHVGLAPASDSAFNAGRSDTKVVTYAAASVAPVLEDIPVYRAHDDHALLFRDDHELLDVLGRLHGDPASVHSLASRARRWVEQARSAERLAEQRDRFYRSLLRAEPAPDRPIGPPGDGAAALRELEHRRPEDVLATVRLLVAADPSYAQARWALAAALEALGRDDDALAELDSFDWPALYGDAVHALRARIRRDTDPAGAAVDVRGVRSPLTRLRLRAHVSDRARFLRDLLVVQPYDHFALAAAIRLHEREDPGAPELADLYERLCLVAPDAVPPERRPSARAPFLPR
jgi:hypothetical protein